MNPRRGSTRGEDLSRGAAEPPGGTAVKPAGERRWIEVGSGLAGKRCKEPGDFSPQHTPSGAPSPGEPSPGGSLC